MGDTPAQASDNVNKQFYYEGFGKPSYTQVPDDFFDILAPELKESELRVLLYIIRRTFGWKKESDAISLSQMVNGIKTKEGKKLDRGTGMSRKAVVAGCAGLVEKGIVVVEKRKSDNGDNDTNIYRLRFKGQPDQKGVVTESNHPGYRSTPPLVTLSNPQQTVIQETVKQQRIDQKKNKKSNNSSGLPAAKQRVVVALLEKGITKTVASRLASRYKEARILEKVDYLDYLLAADPEKIKNPKGWLRTAIEQDYSAPDGWVEDWQERQRAAEAEKARIATAIKQRAETHESAAEARNNERLTQLLDERQTTPEEAEKLAQLWEQTKAVLKSQLTQAQYAANFGSSHLIALRDDTAVIALANNFVVERVAHRLQAQVKRALATNLDTQQLTLEFVALG